VAVARKNCRSAGLIITTQATRPQNTWKNGLETTS
jgi:hypothetical protein